MGRYVKINGELVPIAGIGGGGQDTNFKGNSIADWEALTQEEQDQYDTVDLTDDYTDLTDDIDELYTEIRDLANQVSTLTGELAAYGTNVYIPYPSGYTVDNCVVVGLMVELANNVWIASNYDGVNQVDAVLFETQIAVGAKNTQVANHRYRMILAKI